MYKNRFMKQAFDMSKYSDDPNTKVGCVLVNSQGRKTGIGFNHFPERSTVQFPWGKEGKLYETKYPYVIHAEMAAIKEGMTQNSNFLNNPFEAYVTLFPCSNCAKMLVEAGVTTVYYLSDKYGETEDGIAARKLLEACNVELVKVVV